MTTTGMEGKRVLVVEDEYFIASDLKRILTREGVEVIGPVGDLNAGMRLAEQPLDAAILDVNLEQAMSYPLADRLAARGVPYLFLTGYDGWSLPDRYCATQRLSKPFTSLLVVDGVRKLIGSGG